MSLGVNWVHRFQFPLAVSSCAKGVERAKIGTEANEESAGGDPDLLRVFLTAPFLSLICAHGVRTNGDAQEPQKFSF